MGEQPVSSQSADAGVGQQAARRAMSRCSRRQFRRLFGAYDRAKGHHMAIVPASGWRGSCDVPVGWTEEHQSVHAEPREWSSESGAAPVPWRADISTETRPNGWDHRPLCWPCARAEARPVTPGGHWKRGCARQAGSTGRRGRPARRRDSGEEFWTRVKNSSPEPIEALVRGDRGDCCVDERNTEQGAKNTSSLSSQLYRVRTYVGTGLTRQAEAAAESEKRS
jgi:hypothetical protein